MGSEWASAALRDLVDISAEKIPIPRIPKGSYVSTDNMLPDFGGIAFNDSLPSVAKTSRFSKDDILFSNIRTYFRKLWIADRDGGCSNDVIVFRAKKHLIPKFLFYSLMDEGFIRHTVQTSKGTKMPRGDKSAILQFKATLPPLPEQKAIAHILGSLDDKIELNRRMNATLEGLAQALFKSWFVDFDLVIDNALAAGNPIPDELADRARLRQGYAGQAEDPSSAVSSTIAQGATAEALAKAGFPAAFQHTESMGWIPEGWELGKLSDLLEIKYGKDHKNLNEGNIPVYGSRGLMRYADKSLYSGESVLIPRKGTLSNILDLNEEFWTVDTMFYTVPKIKSAPKYSFYHLKGLDFASMNVGSAVPSMTTKVLNDLPIVLPSANVLEQFDKILTSYFLKTEACNKQNQSLTKIRDTLLPKLISGVLRCSNLSHS